MTVLYYTNIDINDVDVIPGIIKIAGDDVIVCTHKPTLEYIKEHNIDFIVSDRARYLITQDVIDYLPKKIVNLHPSFLPFNRGYNPNYWAIKEGTPYGVSLHYIDATIDTGDIIAQTRFHYSAEDTLRTTYERARHYMVKLFETCWPEIRECKVTPMKQQDDIATLHYKADLESIFDSFKNGWDTKIKDLK